MSKQKMRFFFMALFIFGIISILFIWFGEPGYLKTLSREDGPIENLSAFFYLIGFVASFLCIFKVNGKQKILPIFWAFLCFFFLGEETSWFQRIFHYSVPAIEQASAQKEFNFHNLAPFQGGSWMKSVDLKNLLKSQNLFRMGFFGYFLILPLLTYVTKIKDLMEKTGYKRPDGGFVVVLIAIFFVSFALVFFASPIVKSALAETREMLYAFFIMVYVFVYLWPRQKYGTGG